MVEWKKIEDICGVLRGKRLTKKELTDSGKYPVFHGGVLPIGYYNEYNREGDMVMIINVGASAGTVGYYKNEFWSSDGCFCIEKSSMINNRYLFYFLQSRTRDIQNKVRYAGIPTLDASAVGNIVIPIPSLFEQQHIVKTLDTFTASIDNLKEQIAQRRKQYEHYRDQLLDLEGKEGVEMKKIPEISINCDRKRKPITSSKRVSGNYPYYGASGIVDYVDGYIFDGDYLLISEDGANLLARTTPIAFPIKGRNWVNNHAHVLQFMNMETQKFVETFLNMISLEPWINGAAQPKLNQDNLNRIEIPIPSLEEQSRIVSILDSFEASIANLEEQLALRQKQYEYYREKLLTFN